MKASTSQKCFPNENFEELTGGFSVHHDQKKQTELLERWTTYKALYTAGNW